MSTGTGKVTLERVLPKYNTEMSTGGRVLPKI
jgi:hypothetical protein